MNQKHCPFAKSVPPKVCKFAALLLMTGVLWGSPLVAKEKMERPAPEISAYVDEALAVIREHALTESDVDWPEIRNEAMRLAANAKTTAGAYPAIRFMLAALQDNHSFLQLPEENRAAESDELGHAPEYDGPDSGERKLSPYNKRMKPEFDRLKFGSRVAGYAFMPQGRRDAAFAQAFQQAIGEIHSAGACGWIVDLRGNGGGDIGPMMLGLGPVLGEGEYVGSVDASGGVNAFLYRGGMVWFRDINGKEQEYVGLDQPYDTISPSPPVAVLIDRGTGSSGEILAAAFNARPHTRLFGEPSYGASTFTQGFQLSDGANLVLAVSVVRDVHGNRYENGVAPQVPVPTGEEMLLREDDPAIESALRWLGEQDRCSG